jgi:superfamily II RNA helicase
LIVNTANPELNIALDRLEARFGLAPDDDAVYDAFSQWAKSTGRPLYPHQEEALLAALEGDHLIVATPTGSGKSMVALAAIFAALAHGKTAYYTAPLKALVSEKFFDLIRVFGADNVGMVTGDSAINAEAPVVCATAEIVANRALREGDGAGIGVLVQDEFHFYGDPQRGWAWQVPLLELTSTQEVMLSATLGDTRFFEKDLERRTGRPVSVINDAPRPVPLHFHYSLQPLGELVKEMVQTHRTPAYIVHFSQREAVTQAQELLPINLITKEQKKQIAQAIGAFKFGPGFGQTLSKLLRAGIGVHHAGLLPRYRRLVERLTQQGLLQVICGTDTLGVGINVPIRTVVLTSLSKFDGTRSRHLTAREFHQIAGRAGRAGYDTVGDVVVQAPEYEIENARALAKAGDDPKKLRKVVKKKPPEGQVLWSEKTFEYLQNAQPETLTSQMKVDHSMVLNVLQRPGDAVAAGIKLLTDNHEPPRDPNPLLERAKEIVESLALAGVLIVHDAHWQATHPGESAITFAREVPDDFALNSPLAPFALAALDILDKNSEDYALDVVSVIEAVQEDPKPLLYAQQRAAKGEAIARMKAAGMSYEERMAEADQITWPKPLDHELHAALEIYAQTNPWVTEYELSPKSVVREMVENALTFSELISRYDLARSEGIVLRYLTDTYKALRQTVPLEARTPEIEDITQWLGGLVRSVDSSLLDEWEALRDGAVTLDEVTELDNGMRGGERELAFGADGDGHVVFSRNRHALRTAVRNAAFRRVEALEREDFDTLDDLAQAPLWPGASTWDGDAWADATDPYFDEYDSIGIDQAARGAQYFEVNENVSVADLLDAGMPEGPAAALVDSHKAGRLWLVRQTFADPEGDGSWGFFALVDLDASDRENRTHFAIVSVGER